MLQPWYITGFTDGEGCFSLFINTERKKRKNGTISVYRYWVTTYSITLRTDDIGIANKIRDYFKCGTTTLTKGSNAHAFFLIKSRRNLIQHLIPHFDAYPCIAKKQNDYVLWKEAVQLLWKYDLRKMKFSNPAIPLGLSKEDEKN